MGITKEEFKKLNHGNTVWFDGKPEIIDRMLCPRPEQIGTVGCHRTMDIDNQFLFVSESGKQKAVKGFVFNPWDEASKRGVYASIEDLVAGPPCLHCKFWNPIRDEQVDEDCAGIIICHSVKQHTDFSCYKDKNEPENEWDKRS